MEVHEYEMEGLKMDEVGESGSKEPNDWIAIPS